MTTKLETNDTNFFIVRDFTCYDIFTAITVCENCKDFAVDLLNGGSLGGIYTATAIHNVHECDNCDLSELDDTVG